ncbi:MAG: hypothetical protein V4439_03440 [Patescibacteria group bacterium]
MTFPNPNLNPASSGDNKNFENIKLTPEYFAELLYWSFHLSQNNVPLQHNYFKYLHIVHPDWRASDELANVGKEKLKEKLGDFPHSHKNHTKDSGDAFKRAVDLEIHRQPLHLRDNLNGEILKLEFSKKPRGNSLESLLIESAEMIIDQDSLYIIKGRPNREGKPYESQFCNYVLLGKKTAIPEYDDMFLKMKDPFILKMLVAEKTALVRDVIIAHNKDHPDKRVKIEGLKLDIEI